MQKPGCRRAGALRAAAALPWLSLRSGTAAQHHGLSSDNFPYSYSSLLGISCDCLAFTGFDVYLFDVYLMRLLANKAAWRFRKHFKVALENCLVVFELHTSV